MQENSSNDITYQILLDEKQLQIKQAGKSLEMIDNGLVVKTGEAANCNNYITWSDGDIWRRNMNECAQSWWHQCDEYGWYSDYGETESCVDTDPRIGSKRFFYQAPADSYERYAALS